ncbi:class I SAM-dependent methyltransferase [Sulfobacillus harzensis]|uniref:Class I SAM-dependent methyltransferase n=1 Tax=Sulfobacillus harzensis TaxID=2729629 RepID=A0A7Y0L7T5_9FIRM|nr:class I SAM-dependent methyltransferase [Sulfobacillus harzensis]NMP24786.1 class I SAM-dependent methyltransferase [Sulfobacillus harzensis]
MNPGDWALLSESFYEAMVWSAAERSGLWARLRNGCAEEVLILEGFDGVILEATLRLMAWWGWIRRDPASGLWYQHAKPANAPLARLAASQAKDWASLGERLHPGAKEPSDLAWEDQARLRDRSYELAHWICTVLGDVQGQRWLDVGAGPGVVGQTLSRSGAYVTLADRPLIAKQWNRLDPHLEAWGGDVFQTFPEGLFDGILLARFIESFSPQQVGQLFERCHRHLAPKGRLVVAGYFDGPGSGPRLFDLHVKLERRLGRVYSMTDIERLGHLANFRSGEPITDPVSGYSALILTVASQPPDNGSDEPNGPYGGDEREKLTHLRSVGG